MKCTGSAPAVPPVTARPATASAASLRKSRRPTSVQPPQSAVEFLSVIESGIEENDARERRADPESDARDGTGLELLPRAVAGGRVGVEPFVRALEEPAVRQQHDDQR